MAQVYVGLTDIFKKCRTSVNIRINLHQKLESMLNIFAENSTGLLSALIFTQLFFEIPAKIYKCLHKIRI